MQKISNWLGRHELLIQTSYRVLVVLFLAFLFFRVEESVDMADRARRSAIDASNNAAYAADRAKECQK